MKVIFLDIDGVLNSDQTSNPRKLPYITDRKLLTRFKRVLKRTGAKVVLSSTWRYDPAGLFSAKYYGIPFVDVTPDMPHRPRRDEILMWLKKRPKLDRFVVIDDDDDELDEPPFPAIGINGTRRQNGERRHRLSHRQNKSGHA